MGGCNRKHACEVGAYRNSNYLVFSAESKKAEVMGDRHSLNDSGDYSDLSKQLKDGVGLFCVFDSREELYVPAL